MIQHRPLAVALGIFLFGAAASPCTAQKKLNAPVMRPAFSQPAAQPEPKNAILPRSSPPPGLVLGPQQWSTTLSLPGLSASNSDRPAVTPPYRQRAYNAPFPPQNPWSQSFGHQTPWNMPTPWNPNSWNAPNPWPAQNPWAGPLANNWNNQFVNHVPPGWGLNGGVFNQNPAWGNPNAAWLNGMNVGLPPLAAAYGYNNPLAALFQNAFPGFGVIR